MLFKYSCSLDLFSARNINRVSTLFFCLLILSACGGGGGDNGSNPTPPVINNPPSANAGADINAAANDVVSITGTGSDPEGSVTFLWTQTAGPSVSLTNIDTATMSFTAPESTQSISFEFTLTVTDSGNLIAADTINVDVSEFVLDTPPTVEVGSDITADELTNVILTALGNDGQSEVSYSWIQIAGTTAAFSGMQTSQLLVSLPDVSQIEILSFEVTVTDATGNAIKESVTITVNPVIPNSPPIANAGSDQSVSENTTVILAGTATDEEGGVTYKWRYNGDLNVVITNDMLATAEFLTPNVDSVTVVIIELIVTDAEGLTNTDFIEITITPVVPNSPPSVNAGADRTSIALQNENLEGIVSDSDGNIVSVNWMQISGEVVAISNANTATASFIAPELNQDETLVFQLSATDNNGETSTDQVEILVVSTVSTVLLSEDDLAPEFNDGTTIREFTSVVFGADGQVAITATVNLGAGGIGNALWLGFPESLRLVLKTGDAMPGYSESILFESAADISINGIGQIMFTARLRGNVNTFTDRVLMFASSSVLSVVETELPQSLIDEGYSVPATANYYSLKNNGAIIRRSVIRASTPTFFRGETIFHWKDNTSTIIQGHYPNNDSFTEILSMPMNTDAPFGVNCIAIFTRLAGDVVNLGAIRANINNSGDIIIHNTYRNTANENTCPTQAIVKWSLDANSVEAIVSDGQAVPNSLNTFNLTFSLGALNDDSDVMFRTFIGNPNDANNLGIFPSRQAIFEYGADKQMRFITMQGEKISNQALSNLVLDFEETVLYSKQIGYIVPLANLEDFSRLVAVGEAINNPYETIDEADETHLSTLIADGDTLPGKLSTTVLKALNNSLMTAPRLNEQGNLIFIAVSSDALGQLPDTSGFYGVDSSKVLTEIFDFESEQIFNPNTFEQMTITQFINYSLTNDNHVLLLVKLSNGSNSLVRLKTSLN